jgi:hypothetical protein
VTALAGRATVRDAAASAGVSEAMLEHRASSRCNAPLTKQERQDRATAAESRAADRALVAAQAALNAHRRPRPDPGDRVLERYLDRMKPKPPVA